MADIQFPYGKSDFLEGNGLRSEAMKSKSLRRMTNAADLLPGIPSTW
jgi:hypothetical protein